MAFCWLLINYNGYHDENLYLYVCMYTLKHLYKNRKNCPRLLNIIEYQNFILLSTRFQHSKRAYTLLVNIKFGSFQKYLSVRLPNCRLIAVINVITTFVQNGISIRENLSKSLPICQRSFGGHLPEMYYSTHHFLWYTSRCGCQLIENAKLSLTNRSCPTKEHARHFGTPTIKQIKCTKIIISCLLSIPRQTNILSSKQ